jgi:hypothetical protein
MEMFGMYSTSSINLPESYSGGVSQTPFIEPYNLNRLIQQIPDKTSSGIVSTTEIFDRENGRKITIHYPSFDFMMTESSVSFRAEISPDKLMLLLKCLLILQSLPRNALEEAINELEEIKNFHAERMAPNNLPLISTSKIEGKLSSTVRPPIIFEDQIA